MIKKVGNKYVVYTEDGSRQLGAHDTQQDAIKQLAAIEISKKKQKENKK